MARPGGWTPWLELDFESGEPLYRQVERGIMDAVLTGRVPLGSRLPSSRGLARDLGVSRMTILSALDGLRGAGLIESRPGSGTFVARELPEAFVHGSAGRREAVAATVELTVMDGDGRGEGAMDMQDLRPFMAGLPPLDDFPFRAWNGMLRRGAQRIQTGPTDWLFRGDPKLRATVAELLTTTRGLPCDADEVILTGGLTGSLKMVCRALLSGGDTVWVEDPGLPAVRAAVEEASASAVHVGVDESGFDVERALRAAPDAAMAIVSPSRHFPTGVTMSPARQARLLSWAEAAYGWVVEEDYDAEFALVGGPRRPLAGRDDRGRVIHVGGLSKLLFPVARLGFVVARHGALQELLGASRLGEGRLPLEDQPPLAVQAALADFIAEGHLMRHLRRLRELFRRRRRLLVSLLREALGPSISIPGTDLGLHTLVWLPEGCSDLVMSRELARAGVVVEPVNAYAVQHKARPGLMLGFSAIDEDRIAEGVRSLAEAWPRALEASASRPSTAHAEGGWET